MRLSRAAQLKLLALLLSLCGCRPPTNVAKPNDAYEPSLEIVVETASGRFLLRPDRGPALMGIGMVSTTAEVQGDLSPSLKPRLYTNLLPPNGRLPVTFTLQTGDGRVCRPTGPVSLRGRISLVCTTGVNPFAISPQPGLNPEQDMSPEEFNFQTACSRLGVFRRVTQASSYCECRTGRVLTFPDWSFDHTLLNRLCE